MVPNHMQWLREKVAVGESSNTNKADGDAGEDAAARVRAFNARTAAASAFRLSAHGAWRCRVSAHWADLGHW